LWHNYWGSAKRDSVWQRGRGSVLLQNSAYGEDDLQFFGPQPKLLQDHGHEPWARTWRLVPVNAYEPETWWSPMKRSNHIHPRAIRKETKYAAYVARGTVKVQVQLQTMHIAHRDSSQSATALGFMCCCLNTTRWSLPSVEISPIFASTPSSV